VAPRAACRDQVRGVGGLDPASQLLAPPADRSPYSVVGASVAGPRSHCPLRPPSHRHAQQAGILCATIMRRHTARATPWAVATGGSDRGSTDGHARRMPGHPRVVAHAPRDPPRPPGSCAGVGIRLLYDSVSCEAFRPVARPVIARRRASLGYRAAPPAPCAPAARGPLS